MELVLGVVFVWIGGRFEVLGRAGMTIGIALKVDVITDVAILTEPSGRVDVCSLIMIDGAGVTVVVIKAVELVGDESEDS